MISFFKIIFYYPLLNLLVFFYNFTGSFGLSIIALTIFVRAILFYFSKNAVISQKKMAELQPELKKVQEKYKNNKTEQTKAVMEFYKTNKFNPFSSFLPILIQAPILISLYYVFLKGINFVSAQDLYVFITWPQNIDFYFLGFFDLAHPSKILALLAGASQFLQSKYTMNIQKSATNGEFSSIMNYQMMYFFPVLTFLIGLSLPAGLALYWIVGALFSVIQQLIIEKYYINKKTNIIV